MSRRHTARTLEQPADLTHETEQWWSDSDVTVETIHDWQTAWAETTLDVCEKVWSKQGARLYATHRDALLRDDLRSWLLLEAQTLADQYTPNWDAQDPERYWGAYLWHTLQDHARWHFSEAVGPADRRSGLEARAAHSRITSGSGWGSTDELDDREHADGTIVRRHALHGEYGTEDPLAVIIRLEDFAADIARAERHLRNEGTWRTHTAGVYQTSTTRTDTCLTVGCSRPVRTRGLCATHYEADRLTWAASKGYVCQVPDCGRSHKGRGLCATHLAQYRRGRLPDELQQYVETTPRKRGTPANEAPCSTDGCGKRAEKKGMCGTHYAAAWRAARTATA